MELKELCKEYETKYVEISNRIKNNIIKFKYATNSEDGFAEWHIFDEDTIIITTATYYKGELKAYKNEYILCDYLETDEAFENWLNEKCNARNKIIIWIFIKIFYIKHNN